MAPGHNRVLGSSDSTVTESNSRAIAPGLPEASLAPGKGLFHKPKGSVINNKKGIGFAFKWS